MLNRRDFCNLAIGSAIGAAGMYFGVNHPEKEHNHGEFKLHLCGFHYQKSNLKNQVEAHHFCVPSRDGSYYQCIVRDSAEPNARIIGVEYVITDKVYQSLPEAEKEYWHPHDYEVTAGLLIAPGVPRSQEDELMKFLKPSWGKAVHTWVNLSDPLPMGPPALQWSFNADGQIDKELLKTRDKKFNIDTRQLRNHRKTLDK